MGLPALLKRFTKFVNSQACFARGLMPRCRISRNQAYAENDAAVRVALTFDFTNYSVHGLGSHFVDGHFHRRQPGRAILCPWNIIETYNRKLLRNFDPTLTRLAHDPNRDQIGAAENSSCDL